MKNIISIGFIACLCLKLQAQSDFREGFIVTNENDTIYGLLDYRGNQANAKKIAYKTDINDRKQEYTPWDIQSYRFTDSKYYVSKTIEVGNEPQRLFLEYLIDAIVDIYYYRDESGEHYFFDDGSGNLRALKNEEKEIVIDNNRYMQKSKNYVGLLKYAFKDSPSISNKVGRVKLNHESLIDITNDYHNEVCLDQECIIYEKKLLKPKSTYGLVIGLNGLSLTEGTLSQNYYYLQNSNFGFNQFPSVGLYYKVNMPNINERFYIQYEGTYSRMNLTTSNSYYEDLYYLTYLNDISFSQHAFNNLIMLKYEFPSGKIRPTFQFGGFARYLFTSEYYRDLEVMYVSGNTYGGEESTVSPFSNFDIGFNCGAGLRSTYLNGREIFLDLRYQRGFGMLKGLNTNIISLNLGLQIGK